MDLSQIPDEVKTAGFGLFMALVGWLIKVIKDKITKK